MQGDSMSVSKPFDKLGDRRLRDKAQGADPELAKGLGVMCEGRGDLGVRFDRLNELRDGKVFERAGS